MLCPSIYFKTKQKPTEKAPVAEAVQLRCDGPCCQLSSVERMEREHLGDLGDATLSLVALESQFGTRLGCGQQHGMCLYCYSIACNRVAKEFSGYSQEIEPLLTTSE